VRFDSIGKRFGIKIQLVRIIPPEVPDLGKYTVASIFRLLIPRLFEGEERVIYLDSDIILNQLDINQLLEVSEPSTAALMAVRDPFIKESGRHCKELIGIGLSAEDYFNSGVLVFNLKRHRPPDLLDEFLAWVGKWGVSAHPDQNFLNARFVSNVDFLDERFNFQVTLYARRLFLQPSEYLNRILHFSGQVKPLDGSLGPGTLPFFAYAGLVPEIYSVLSTGKLRYLFPSKADVNGVERKALTFIKSP
jgi:lipopolysaccharide biosynthesis glycosyltransferase